MIATLGCYALLMWVVSFGNISAVGFIETLGQGQLSKVYKANAHKVSSLDINIVDL